GVTVAARRAEAIEELRPVAAGLGVPLAGVPWDSALRLLDRDVVISTVPKGVADPLVRAGRFGAGPEPRFGRSTVVFDALYDPWPTPLAATAQAHGCRIVSGLDLLLAQALGQFTQFTGVPAPVDAMRAALHAARA
ncbi:MAG TPA: shikimate dehydrogenase, partial [Micromonosporaceae bacterium]|nr:shikimate dehydrogenase [Micromonosporaceae bacterium]